MKGGGRPRGGSGAARSVGGGEIGMKLRVGMASVGRIVGVSGGSLIGMGVGSNGILILILI